MLSISRNYSSPTNHVVRELFGSLCEETQSPVSSVLRHLGDLELSRFRIRPEDYSSACTFRHDYLVVSLLSKWKGLMTGIDTKSVAISAFEKQELICQATNLRLRNHNTAFVTPIIHRAQRLIAKVLGPFSLKLFDGLERWGPGACTDLKRSSAYLDAKMTTLPIPVTRSALAGLASAIQSDLHWSYCILDAFPVGPYSLLPHNFAVVEGSLITTVPKSAKTDRTIAIEPRGNMFLQKSVGTVMRRKLRRYGIDLDDQTLNQVMASQAHITLHSTIDLSMASDSMSEELIYELLPIDWALYLNDIRSRSYSLDGVKYTPFRKFSSMGNGFTFELESLIFYAITMACLSDDSSKVAVYGDDIILPQVDAHVLISALSYFGFETNVEKSYIEGRFFESCGKHYFDGIDVTPFYQKEIVNDFAEHVRLLNRLARYLVRQTAEDPDSFSKSVGFNTWHNNLKGRITRWTPTLPLGCEGDDGYLVNHTVFSPKKWKRSYGYQWVIARRAKVTIPGNSAPLLAYSLRQNSNQQGILPVFSKSSLTASEDLESRSAIGRLDLTTRWIEPSWEYFMG